MWSLRVPRHLDLLPGRKSGIEIRERLRGFGLELVQLLADRHGLSVFGQRTQFVDLGFEFCDGLFEVEIGAH